jgi:hypothetical protein
MFILIEKIKLQRFFFFHDDHLSGPFLANFKLVQQSLHEVNWEATFQSLVNRADEHCLI